MNTSRQTVIELLERALQAAQDGQELPEVAQLATSAAKAAGKPPNLLQLVRETRAKGFPDEADILALAIDVASAVGDPARAEVHEHSLICLHDVACERLDEVHHELHQDEEEKVEGETKEPPRTVSRLN